MRLTISNNDTRMDSEEGKHSDSVQQNISTINSNPYCMFKQHRLNKKNQPIINEITLPLEENTDKNTHKLPENYENHWGDPLYIKYQKNTYDFSTKI
jgi:hypothetical protein